MIKLSLKEGFTSIAILVATITAFFVFASVSVLGFRDSSRGRSFTESFRRPSLSPSPRVTPSPTPSLTPAPSPTASGPNTKVYWLIPAGQTPVPEFAQGLPPLLQKNRQFFANQLDGKTFKIEGGVLRIQSSRPAPWFYGCDSGGCGYPDRQWRINNEWAIWDRVKKDLASKRIFVDQPNSHTIVILAPGTFQYGTGGGFGLGNNQTGGMAILGEQKTAGSLGLPSPEAWCQPVESQSCINQVIGSFIHEVGHSFGLAHPQDPADQDISIMWSWWKYPDIGLTQKEKEQLLKNPAMK